MKPFRDTDVEEELSIAYFHAVCAGARMCKGETTRHEDNRGVDTKIVGWKPFGTDDGYLTEVDLKVQLKATKQQSTETNTHFSYFLDSVPQYDDLRRTDIATPRILVVLFLPDSADEWLLHSHDQLLLKRCAYWVSLRGASPSSNKTGQTVSIPKNQPFSPESLRTLASLLSHGPQRFPTYQSP